MFSGFFGKTTQQQIADMGKERQKMMDQCMYDYTKSMLLAMKANDPAKMPNSMNEFPSCRLVGTNNTTPSAQPTTEKAPQPK